MAGPLTLLPLNFLGRGWIASWVSLVLAVLVFGWVVVMTMELAEIHEPKQHSSGVMEDWPVWARVAAWLGLPAIFAGALLYFVLVTVSHNIDAHQELLVQHDQRAVEMDRVVRQHFESEHEQTRLTLAILRNFCAKFAKTTKEAAECWDGKP